MAQRHANATNHMKFRSTSIVLWALLALLPSSYALAQSLTLPEFLSEAVPQWKQVRQAIDRVTLCRLKVRDWSPQDREPVRVDKLIRKSPNRFLQIYDARKDSQFFLVRDLQTLIGNRLTPDSPWSISELNDFSNEEELEEHHFIELLDAGFPMLDAISADLGVLLEDFFNNKDFHCDSIVRENNFVTVKCSWVNVDQDKGRPRDISYDRLTFVFDAARHYQWIKKTGSLGKLEKQPAILLEQFEVTSWTPFDNLSLPQTLTIARSQILTHQIVDRCTLDIEYSTEPNREEDFSLSQFGIPEITPRKAGFKRIYLLALVTAAGAALIVWRFRGNLGLTRAS
jgi:hypothetical protein